MGTKRRTCDIRTWEQHLFLDICSTTYTSKPATQKYFDCCLSHFCASASTSLSSTKSLPRFWTQLWTASHEKHFLPLRGNISLWISFALSPFTHKKTHNRTLHVGSTILKHGRHFDYWRQPLNMSMRVCYLDYHEAGLCCYLVISTGNLLHPLQLLYFHLWLIYWLPVVNNKL
jgi:hypothetical protein